MSDSSENAANDRNNPGAGLDGGNNTPNANGGGDTKAQTTQPLLLDQASLDAIISGVSSRIMSQPRSQPSTGRNAPPIATSHKQQRQLT